MPTILTNFAEIVANSMDALSRSDADILGSLISELLVITGIILIFAAVFYILLVVAEWKIFTKAGEKGWKSLIPIYNLYIMFKLFYRTDMFWILLGSAFCVGIINGIIGEDSLAGMLLALALAIFEVVVMIKLYSRLAKSFGHGTGFIIGLVFLPSIFTLILGFNKDKYRKLAK